MKRFSKILAAACAALALTAPPAAATVLLMTLTDVTGGAFLTCDNGVGGCNAGFGGIINGNTLTYTGGVGSWTSALTAGTTNSPGAALGLLDLTQLVLTNTTGAARSFQILITAFGFTSPPGDPLFFFGSASTSSSSANAGTIVSQSYFDPNNTGALLNMITCNFAANSNNSCAETGINVFNAGGAFSITQVLNINLLGAHQSVNLTANQSVRGFAAPEPGSLALTAGALLIAGGVARRRRS
jgi:hypothetical protein